MESWWSNPNSLSSSKNMAGGGLSTSDLQVRSTLAIFNFTCLIQYKTQTNRVYHLESTAPQPYLSCRNWAQSVV